LPEDIGLGLGFEGFAPALAEQVVFTLGLGVGFFAGDGAGIGEDGALVEAQELVELGLPVFEEDLFFAAGLVFRIVEEHDDDAVEFVDFRFPQVVLGDGHVGLVDAAGFPGG